MQNTIAVYTHSQGIIFIRLRPLLLSCVGELSCLDRSVVEPRTLDWIPPEVAHFTWFGSWCLSIVSESTSSWTTNLRLRVAVYNVAACHPTHTVPVSEPVYVHWVQCCTVLCVLVVTPASSDVCVSFTNHHSRYDLGEEHGREKRKYANSSHIVELITAFLHTAVITCIYLHIFCYVQKLYIGGKTCIQCSSGNHYIQRSSEGTGTVHQMP